MTVMEIWYWHVDPSMPLVTAVDAPQVSDTLVLRVMRLGAVPPHVPDEPTK